MNVLEVALYKGVKMNSLT